MNRTLQLLSQSPKNVSRRLTAALLLGAFALTAGCFGKFPLTKSAYRFNETSSENEFVQTIVYWAMFVYYPFAILGDTLVLNPIEFWTDKTLDIDGIANEGPTRFTGSTLKPIHGEEKLYTLESRGLSGETIRLLLSRENENQFDVLNPETRKAVGRIQRAKNGDALLCSVDGTLLQRLPAVLGITD